MRTILAVIIFALGGYALGAWKYMNASQKREVREAVVLFLREKLDGLDRALSEHDETASYQRARSRT